MSAGSVFGGSLGEVRAQRICKVGGTVYSPAITDFTFMVRETSSMSGGSCHVGAI